MMDAVLFLWAGACLYDGGVSFVQKHYGRWAWATFVAVTLICVGTYLRTKQ